MFGSSDILQAIIRQSAKGYPSWQVEPVWVPVEKNEKETNRPEILSEIESIGSQYYLEVNKTIGLNNDILILTNKELDIPVSSTLILESHDNLFTITKAKYAAISFYKYQVFSNYLRITLKGYDNYVPFQLEFLRIKPGLTACHILPFGIGHYLNGIGNCRCNNNLNPENDD